MAKKKRTSAKDTVSAVSIHKKPFVMKDELEAARGKGLSGNDLRQETEYTSYIKRLAAFAKRYAVFIVASDTPTGPAFTEEHAAELVNMGVHTDLFGKDWLSYAVAIIAGEHVFESIAISGTHSVEQSFFVGNTQCRLESYGSAVPSRKPCVIEIGDKDYSPHRWGLNFVVYDMVTDTLIDAVNFDTNSAMLRCIRPAATENALIDFQSRHPGVSILCFSGPLFPTDHLSDNEQLIKEKGVHRGVILSNLDKQIFELNKYFRSEQIIEVLQTPRSYHDIYGVRRFEDIHGALLNISGGHRVTTDQPKKANRTVYLVGGCNTFGFGSADRGTIASHLQRMFNQKAPGHGVIVQNYGFCLSEVDTETNEEIRIIHALPVKPGDWILCAFGLFDKLPCLDLGVEGVRPHNHGEFFFDFAHYTENANQFIADRLFDRMIESNEFHAHDGSQDKGSVIAQYHRVPEYDGFDDIMQESLEEYKWLLKELFDRKLRISVGAVVVNCNPFTLGHQYLIEQAASKVDQLMVFVVQEDLSEFTFEDRLNMVDLGTADIGNVTVLPSGRFIISSLTFSEYFNKSELQDRQVDPTLDIEIFAKEIAPCLNISVRFVGEEPFDQVTRQYNDAMRAQLPLHGIDFVEIPRKASANNEPISASRVRELIQEENFVEIAEIVPKTTLDYLYHHVHSNDRDALYDRISESDWDNEEVFSFLFLVRLRQVIRKDSSELDKRIQEALSKSTLLRELSLSEAVFLQKAIAFVLCGDYFAALDGIIRLAEGEIPEDFVKAYLELAQNLSAAVEDSDAFLFFKKLWISYLLDTERMEEAAAELDEYQVLMPEDEDFAELRSRLR